MIAYPVALAIAVLGLGFVASGAALAAVPRTRVGAGALVLAGLSAIAGALLDATGRYDAGQVALVAGGALCFPVALTAYPRVDWRHPVDFVAWIAVPTCGAVAVVQATNPPVMATIAFVEGCVVFVHTWWKIERADQADRRALIWVSLAVSVAGIVVFLVVFVVPGTPGGVVAVLSLAAIGPAMYVGVRRPEVTDVRGLVVRVTVDVTAAVGYVSAFVALASSIEILGGSMPSVATLAVIGAVVATTFHPMQVVLRGVVDQLLFGTRPDPLDAATRVVGHIGDDPQLALRAIRQSLLLPYASLSVDGVSVAKSGVAVTHTRTLDLPLGQDAVGELVVGLRPGDLSLSPGDQHVLSLVAPLLAQTLRASRLASDLRASRGQAVTAIEEERRRLRRDLHDGLGPRLSGIAFTSDAVRNTLRSDPAAAEDLLSSLRRETVTAIEDIRQLVYGMRPPALDELGLVPALQQQFRSLRTPDGTPLRVELVATDLPSVPAAVEVATYRIVGEALTNAARHSGSTQARVSLRVADGSLLVEIQDGGAGSCEWQAGVGLASMRERAAELGGSLTARAGARGGCVHAVLPLPT